MDRYILVVNANRIGEFTYEECREEIERLFGVFRMVGMTMAITSPTTGKIVDIYYLDKDFKVGHVAIN